MMFSTLFTTTLLFAIFGLRARADFVVPTIALTQCKPATLTWDPTDGPYNVIVTLASNPCGDPLVDLGDHDTNSFTWDKVNVPAGQTVMVSVLNKGDQEGWSGAITVQSSDDSSCLTSQDNTPSEPTHPPNYSSPSPTTPTSSSKPPAATVVGAANNGIMDSGASTIHLSGMAVAFTAFCAFVALL